MIESAGIKVWNLSAILAELKGGKLLLQAAAGAHLIERIELTAVPTPAA